MRIALLVVVGLVIAAALAWNAGEMRYDNCLQAAQAEHPLGEAGLTTEEREESARYFGGETDPSADISARPLERRQDAIADCSRLPW